MSQQGESKWFADGEAYEQLMGRWSRPVGHMFLNWLSQPPGLRWADVGCGTGALTGMVLKQADPESVIGIEPSEGFLSAARASFKDIRAEFRTGDAQSLPLETHQMDVAVSGLVLNFVPDKKRALAEMRRIVRPGGTVAAYVWDPGKMELMHYFWDAVVELNPDARKLVEEVRFPFANPDSMANLFGGAGLEAVQTCNLDAPTHFSDFDDYWSPFLRGQGPAGAYCVSLPEKDRESLRRHLEKVLPINGDGTLHLTARAWAVRGTV